MTQDPLSQRLMTSILKLELPEHRFTGKMELSEVVSELMPAGVPQFLSVTKYPKIADLKETIGLRDMHKLIFLLVKDFCNSLNVVRNMNEDQMIEAAGMLMDECDNFRLEDYTMMFTMAKRGGLIKIYDRIDLQVITDIFDAYWIKRNNAAVEAEERAITRQEAQLPVMRSTKPGDYDKMDSIGGALSDMKQLLRDK